MVVVRMTTLLNLYSAMITNRPALNDNSKKTYATQHKLYLKATRVAFEYLDCLSYTATMKVGAASKPTSAVYQPSGFGDRWQKEWIHRNDNRNKRQMNINFLTYRHLS